MRDPARIARMIELLRELWHRWPDQRLGQLIVNVIRPGEPCPRVFYAEDDNTEAKLLALLASEPDDAADPALNVTTKPENQT